MGAPGTVPGVGYAGAEGIYTVTVTASGPDNSVGSFTWDVGRWGAGDVFVGAGNFKYQVYAKDGTFKYDVVVPEVARPDIDPDTGQQYIDPDTGQLGWLNGTTTGCAENWHTGEVWATNLDDVKPAVNVITRHAPYTDVSRRLSTERYQPNSIYSIDHSPESIAFDNSDNMYVGHTAGLSNNDGDPADILGHAVMHWFDDNLQPVPYGDTAANLLIVDPTGAPIQDENGGFLQYDTWISPDGYYQSFPEDSTQPVYLLGLDHLRIPIREQAGRNMHRYTLGPNGYTNSTPSSANPTDRTFYNARVGQTGTDEIDLLSDQRTMIYTSESQYVYRYDLGDGTHPATQLPVLGSNDVNSPAVLFGGVVYGLRALPPGDGTGGYLVVDEHGIGRYAEDGRTVQRYGLTLPNDPDYYDPIDNPLGQVDGWFALAIAPDGRTFWAANRQDVFHFDIATGALIGSKIHATDGVVHTSAELAGLCVVDEYRAAQEVCSPTPSFCTSNPASPYCTNPGTGNGIDDDGDGVIDEGCFRIEVCSATSPGDDDGDGLVDFNDPDCGAPPERQCTIGGPTDASVPGFCERGNAEGDAVSVQSVPGATSYGATGLPPGLSIDSQTGEISGSPLYTIVNPNASASAPVVYDVDVTWTPSGSQVFHNLFKWTISNTNRPPTAQDDTASVLAGASVDIDVQHNDSDVDGDHITIVPGSITAPLSGNVSTGSVVQVGQQLRYTAPLGFGGEVTFTYQVQDDYASPVATSNVATVTVIVNGPPVARDDHYEMAGGTTLTIAAAQGLISNSAGSDSDPEGQTVTVAGGPVTAPGNGSVTVNADGSFSYTPTSGFSGTDTFTYRVTDGTLNSNVATVTIVVHAPPVAVDDLNYFTFVNTALNAGGNPTPRLLANDLNPDGNVSALRLVLSSVGEQVAPAHGTVVANPDLSGSFIYTPTTGYLGTDTFTYRVTNGLYESNTATVRINITAANHPPVAVDDYYTVNQGALLSVPAGAILSNDSDQDGDELTVEKLADPTYSAEFQFTQGTGAFAFRSQPDFVGNVTIVYVARDTYNAISNFATVHIHVNGLPLAVNDTISTGQNLVVNGSAQTNDTPSGDGGNTWSLVGLNGGAQHGLVVMLPTGAFVYTPGLLYSGTDVFTYQVCDVNNVLAYPTLAPSDCSTATVTINITGRPVAVDDTFTTLEDTPLSGTLTGNDTPSGDGGNVWSKTSNPAHGAATVNADGTFTYTPNANYNGGDSFNYKLCDRNLHCATATATITITAVNDLPIAVSDTKSTTEDVAVSGSAQTNDTPSGDGGNAWTLVGTNGGALHGTVTMTSTGDYTYTPVTGTSGTDVFTYRLCDGTPDCVTATVTITIAAKRLDVTATPVCVADAPYVQFAITAVNFTPVVGATATLTWKDSTGAVKQTTVLPWTNTAAPLTGQVLWPGAVLDTAGHGIDWPGWLLQGGLWVQGSDGFENTRPTSTVEISVNPTTIVSVTYPPATPTCNAAPGPNQPPVAVDDAYTTAEDTPLTVPATGILTNDTDPEHGPLTVALPVVAGPTHGTLTQNADGSLTYTPAPDYNGTDSYTYKVRDAAANLSNTATVRITITPVNDLPVAVNDTNTTSEDTPVSGLAGTNDTPSGDGGNTWTLVGTNGGALHGTVTMTTAGSYTYTPAANYNGTDLFTYQLCDGTPDCVTATVAITIAAVNDPPVAVNDAASTQVNTPVTITVLGNDTDIDGDTLTVTSSTAPTSGSVAQSGNQFVFTPAAAGTATFNYTISDGHGGTASALVTVTIVNPNRPPVAVNDAVTTSAGVAVSITVLTNDSDPDGDVLSVTSNTNAARGTVTRSGNLFSYTPAMGFSGLDSFTYTISDGHGGTATATVLITVTACETGPSTTYTQGGWGATPSGNNPGALLQSKFLIVYPSGSVQIGGGRTLTFTSADAIKNYLPRGGTPGRLTNSAVNPTWSGGGVFAGQVLALRLNVDFSTAHVTKAGLANKILASGKLAGSTVGQVLTLANGVLGGASTPAGISISDLNAIVDSINQNYDNGTCDNGYLLPEAACTVQNRAPVAVNDGYATLKNTRLNIASPGIKVNDSDPDGDAISAQLVSTTTHGTLTISADGSFTYMPASNYVGTDSFKYRVKDASGLNSNTATVTITITSVVCSLSANDDAYATNKNHAITIAADGVLANDADPYDRGLTVSQVNGSSSKVGVTVATSHGSVKVNSDGSFTYTPANDYAGTDSFSYTAKSPYGYNSSDAATVTITIAAHYDGDGCDHDRHRGGHLDGDRCAHDKAMDHHYAGDGCDHDRKRNGHHDGDGCSHDRDLHRHYAGDGCDHELGRDGHYAGDRCEHELANRAHYDGDGCDHDRNRWGHRDGDRCDHDRQTSHHNDGDQCDHELKTNGHFDGDGCDHDREDHSHAGGDGCDHDRKANGHYDGDRCEHDQHRGDVADDENACVVKDAERHHYGDGDDHHSGDDDDRDGGHHSGDFCDHDRKRNGHRDGDGCDHDRIVKHYDGDSCDHDRKRNGHRDGDGCDHDRSSRDDHHDRHGRGGETALLPAPVTPDDRRL